MSDLSCGVLNIFFNSSAVSELAAMQEDTLTHEAHIRKLVDHWALLKAAESQDDDAKVKVLSAFDVAIDAAKKTLNSKDAGYVERTSRDRENLRHYVELSEMLGHQFWEKNPELVNSNDAAAKLALTKSSLTQEPSDKQTSNGPEASSSGSATRS